jgi:hypothetical protein
METACSKRFAFGSATRENYKLSSVRSGSYVPGVSRLRPLNESECYARLYGDRESTVAVIRKAELERPSGGLLGEQLRKLISEQLDDDDQPEVEAA